MLSSLDMAFQEHASCGQALPSSILRQLWHTLMLNPAFPPGYLYYTCMIGFFIMAVELE